MWNEASYFTELAKKLSASDLYVVQQIYEWSQKHAAIEWGRGKRWGCFRAVLAGNLKNITLFAVYEYGVELQFSSYTVWPPFDNLEKRKEMQRLFNEIPGVDITEEKIDKRPSISLKVLNKDSLEKFYRIFEWFIGESEKYRTEKKQNL